MNQKIIKTIYYFNLPHLVFSVVLTCFTSEHRILKTKILEYIVVFSFLQDRVTESVFGEGLVNGLSGGA